MNQSQALACVASVLAVSLTAAIGQLVAPGGFDLSQSTIDSGGGTSTGGTFSVSGAIAQPDAGTPMAGGAFNLAGGFFPGVQQLCSADITGNGVVNIEDLLALISVWGPCVGCPADIAPPGGDGVVNIADLLAVISGWGMCQ
jgi:hypothetical protein